MRVYYQVIASANSKGPGSNDRKARLVDVLMPTGDKRA